MWIFAPAIYLGGELLAPAREKLLEPIELWGCLYGIHRPAGTWRRQESRRILAHV